jgi:hypothetical protein
MSLPTTPDQLGLVTTIDIYPGGRSKCVPCIDHVPHPRGWSAWPVSPVFTLNTSFLLKHALDRLLAHCSEKMTAQLHKIRGQIPNSAPCISFIRTSTDHFFRVIDQTSLPSITHVIFDPNIPLYEPNKRLEQFRESIMGLINDPKVLRPVQLHDVLRAPAEEGRLGPCRFQDAAIE